MVRYEIHLNLIQLRGPFSDIASRVRVAEDNPQRV
jgi:hypothetical protein